jgi:DNA-directed RNA polymerase subunit RPC12/RpoP
VITIIKPRPPSLGADPKGRRPERHFGRTGQHIPGASLVGLLPTGEKDPAAGINAAESRLNARGGPQKSKRSACTTRARAVVLCVKCGAAFERERKRGRPAKRCPKCLKRRG